MRGCVILACLVFVMEVTAVDKAKAAAGDHVRLQMYREAEFNEPCRTPTDCRSFGYDCEYNRTCKCARFYIPDIHRRTCVGGVNQKCIYDEHCIEGAYCYNQAYCRCKEKTPYISEDGLVCSGWEENRLPSIQIYLFTLTIKFVVEFLNKF